MDIDFWLERWNSGRTGFHQDHINPYAAYFYGEKGPPLERRKDLKVFVPLCGKSKDLLWLAQNGYQVFGVECSDRAVKSFFEENALSYKHAEKGEYGLYQNDEQVALIEILQGDFFGLEPETLDDVTDIFDRASLVALPPGMRQDYVNKIDALQKPGTRTLLVTLNFDPAEMDGPPFSVTDEEVLDLYSENFTIDKLLSKNVIDEETGLKNRGLTALTESVFKLVKR
ncbi:MAG TPA: thiopurine S-methyltransferase [Gammaproteobacteria bacterium]|nr:thiopurine S-methyltransferase [Gammaproteobacteria bacterium]